MSEHRATIAWEHTTDAFDYDSYTRDHTWSFDGGQTVSASAAPEYLGSASGVDPEEAFVASVGSCHMLTFLAVAARKRLTVLRYRDAATGTLEKNAAGRLAITRVLLRPEITWADGMAPDAVALERLHEAAHKACFIANSVNCIIEVA